jgi:hypothetical protein
MSNEKTAISEIKNLMKKFGFYTETPIVEEKFLDAKLKDGTVIKVEGEELVEGAKVVVVTEEGEVPAPDGVHELEDGSKVETKEGIVAKIEAPEMEEEPKIEVEVEAEEEVVEDKVDVTEELYALLKDMMEKISDKMKKMEEKMEKVENDFENFKKEPASSKIKTGKTEEKFSKENNLLEDRIKTVMALRGK